MRSVYFPSAERMVWAEPAHCQDSPACRFDRAVLAAQKSPGAVWILRRHQVGKTDPFGEGRVRGQRSPHQLTLSCRQHFQEWLRWDSRASNCCFAKTKHPSARDGCKQVATGEGAPRSAPREHERFSNQELAVRTRPVAGRTTPRFERSASPNWGSDSILKHPAAARCGGPARKSLIS